MHHFALLFYFLTFPASPAPAAFTAISQHFNGGAGGDWVGNVGSLCLGRFQTFLLHLLTRLVKHLLVVGG